MLFYIHVFDIMRVITDINSCSKADLHFLKFEYELTFTTLSLSLDMSVSNLQKNFSESSDGSTLSFSCMFLLSAQLVLEDNELTKVFNHMKSFGFDFNTSLVG